MTIEALLQEQNKIAADTNVLLKTLIEQLTAGYQATPAVAKAVVEQVASKVETKAEAKVEAKAEAAKVETKAEVKEETVAAAVTYDDVKNAITAVVRAKGRDAGLAVLAIFNTESATTLAPAQWQAVIDACKAAL